MITTLSSRTAIAFTLGAAALAGAAAPPSKAVEDLLVHHNRGVSLMERHQFAEAAVEFEKVVKAAPDLVAGQVNLGLAYMNGAKEYEKAGQAFRKAIALDGKDPRAHFSLAVMLESLGRKDEALKELELALATAPADADVHFKLGQLAQAKGDTTGAMAAYERAHELDPGFASALYALGLLEVRAGKRDQGKAHLDLFEQLRRTKQGRTWGLKYTEMGRLADVIRFDPTMPRTALAAGPSFSLSDTTPADGSFGKPAPSLVAADVDGDGDVDLLAGSRLLLNDGGHFSDASAAAGVDAASASAPAWLMDSDNDGDLDMVTIAPAALRPWNAGSWGKASPLPAPDSTGFTVAELDADGDADLLATGKTARMLVNGRDGTFSERTLEPPLGAGVVAVLAFDLDGDVDSDLLLLGPEPRLLLNQRLWRFDAIEAPLPKDGTAAAAGDLDGDGDLDVVVAGGSGIQLLTNDRGKLAEPVSIMREAVTTVDVVDMDRDGRLEIVAGRAGSKPAIVVLAGDGGEPLAYCPLPAPPVAVALLDADGDGDLDVAVALGAAGVRLVGSRGSEKSHGLAVTLAGPEKAGEARSNRLGIGARIEAKVGGNVQVLERTAGSGRSQSLGPLCFGLAGSGKVDYLRIVWPDGVIQSETELPAGAVTLEEVQRKAGSCPTLFAWNGSRHAFVADFLGGGGIGFYVSPGVYAPPDPDEIVSIPALAARDGLLDLRIVEPLEEITYLDHVALLAVEHPIGTEVHPDERFAVAAPPATGAVIGVAEPRLPVRAVDGTGTDVTERLRHVDRSYIGPSARDPHFLGLASPTVLTLDFGAPLPDDAVLFLQGFIEYGYSGTVFAAAQAGRSYDPPALEFRDPGSLAWRPAALLGYPAGSPRTMTYPLRGVLPPGVRELRIRSNMSIYWDRIFVASDAAPPDGYRITRLAPVDASLRPHGYPREYSPDGALPLLYDYENSDPTRGFKRAAGDYTRFGDVAPLLRETDDSFVIMGPGDEVALLFDPAQVPAPQPGNRISYMLASAGFCKDMDLYTAAPDTVEPLPFRAMSAYPYPAPEHYPDDPEHADYRRAYNTRRVPKPRP